MLENYFYDALLPLGFLLIVGQIWFRAYITRPSVISSGQLPATVTFFYNLPEILFLNIVGIFLAGDLSAVLVFTLLHTYLKKFEVYIELLGLVIFLLLSASSLKYLFLILKCRKKPVIFMDHQFFVYQDKKINWSLIVDLKVESRSGFRSRHDVLVVTYQTQPLSGEHKYLDVKHEGINATGEYIYAMIERFWNANRDSLKEIS